MIILDASHRPVYWGDIQAHDGEPYVAGRSYFMGLLIGRRRSVDQPTGPGSVSLAKHSNPADDGGGGKRFL